MTIKINELRIRIKSDQEIINLYGLPNNIKKTVSVVLHFLIKITLTLSAKAISL